MFISQCRHCVYENCCPTSPQFSTFQPCPTPLVYVLPSSTQEPTFFEVPCALKYSKQFPIDHHCGTKQKDRLFTNMFESEDRVKQMIIQPERRTHQPNSWIEASQLMDNFLKWFTMQTQLSTVTHFKKKTFCTVYSLQNVS